MQTISFTIVSGEVEARHFANAVGRTRMKPCSFRLRDLRYLTEHLARSREVKPAFRDNVPQRGEQIVRPIDVGLERGELVIEGVADETLGG